MSRSRLPQPCNIGCPAILPIDAAAAFLAAGHSTPLEPGRRRLAAGPSGMAAGAIANALGVPPATGQAGLGVPPRARDAALAFRQPHIR